MQFWLNRGVSSFRIDVIDHISKVQTFADAENISSQVVRSLRTDRD